MSTHLATALSPNCFSTHTPMIRLKLKNKTAEEPSDVTPLLDASAPKRKPKRKRSDADETGDGDGGPASLPRLKVKLTANKKQAKSSTKKGDPKNAPKIKLVNPLGTASKEEVAEVVTTAATAGSPESQRASTPRSTPKVVLKSKKDKVPKIRVKSVRQSGSGYDSEAPDREEDPMIEEAVVLRMVPGQHLDFLRAACEGEQGELKNVSIKFKDARRAVVTIHGQLFAAKLVDLPTITEAHKSFDRKNIYKVADVCQMLMVTEPIQYEDDVYKLESTSLEGDAGPTVPHGITPPLYNVRRRRFRKRISRKVIESVEARVDELFRKDKEAIKTAYEVLDANSLNGVSRAGSVALTPKPGDEEEEDDEEEDDEEEEEEEEDTKHGVQPAKAGGALFSKEEEDMGFSDLDIEFEKALKSVASEGNDETKGHGAISKPRAEEEDEDEEEEEEEDEEEEDEDDDDDDDEDEDEDEDEDDDDEAQEAVKRYKIVREEIRDLVHSLSQKEKEAEARKNPILKNRVLNDIKKIKQEIEIKKRQLKNIPGHKEDDLDELLNAEHEGKRKPVAASSKPDKVSEYKLGKGEKRVVGRADADEARVPGVGEVEGRPLGESNPLGESHSLGESNPLTEPHTLSESHPLTDLATIDSLGSISTFSSRRASLSGHALASVPVARLSSGTSSVSVPVARLSSGASSAAGSPREDDESDAEGVEQDVPKPKEPAIGSGRAGKDEEEEEEDLFGEYASLFS